MTDDNVPQYVRLLNEYIISQSSITEEEQDGYLDRLDRLWYSFTEEEVKKVGAIVKILNRYHEGRK